MGVDDGLGTVGEAALAVDVCHLGLDGDSVRSALPGPTSVGHEVAGPHGLHDVAYGVQDQLRLLVLDIVTGLGDHIPATRD